MNFLSLSNYCDFYPQNQKMLQIHERYAIFRHDWKIDTLKNLVLGGKRERSTKSPNHEKICYIFPNVKKIRVAGEIVNILLGSYLNVILYPRQILLRIIDFFKYQNQIADTVFQFGDLIKDFLIKCPFRSLRKYFPINICYS